MNVTPIGWTDFSANPLKYRTADGRTVWGCAKVSAGCTHCYSEALALRWNRGAPYNAGEMANLTPFLDVKEMRQMATAQAIKGKPLSGSRVFVGDMTDLFGEWVPFELLDELFTLFAERSDVTWQVLTKRAGRMQTFLGTEYRPLKWPLPNVWIGVSVEDQQRANERIPILLQTPADVRFISAEPLLSDVELMPDWFYIDDISGVDYGTGLDWVIVGGESGPKFRDCGVAPILGVVRRCQAVSVPVFVKQDAHRLPGQQGRIPAEFFVHQFPAAARRRP